MTKAELDELLEPFTAGRGIGATVYLILETDGRLSATRADVPEQTQTEIRDFFLGALRREILDKANLNVLDLSTADERINSVYRYDLNRLPESLLMIDEVLNNDDLPDFSFATHRISESKAIVVLIGNDAIQLAIYKKSHPFSVLKRSRFLLMQAETRLEKVNSEILMLSDRFDFFKVDGELIIFNLATLERFFGFHDVIEREARNGLDTIVASNLLENPDELETLLREISSARKLIKVTANSPLFLNGLQRDQVVQFTRTYAPFIDKFRYSPDGSRIRLDTKESKLLFLKLLNDDYLVSELTRRIYDTMAKDVVTET